MANTLHQNLTGSELHYSKIDESVLTIGSPPSYIGQSFFDTVNSIFYIAIGTSSVSDWQPVNGTGGTNSVVDSASTSYTVTTSNNGAVIRLTSGSARAVTLPNTPINGFTVSIQDAYSTTGAAYTNNITVTASGSDLFQSGLASYKITSNLACATFTYDTGLTCWVVRSSFIGLNPTVTTLTGTLGSDLVIGTADTNNVKLQVNSVDSLAVSTTNFEIKKNLVVDDISDITKQLAFSLGSSTTGTKTALNFVQTANRVITFPDLTDTLVSKTSTDILTNKSFNNTTTMLAANQLNFNNSGNTFHTSLKAGANAADLDMTLPTTAPLAGQVLYSTDIAGTLSWLSIPGVSQTNVASATNINALTSSASSVLITGSTTTNLNGIVAGSGGQEVTVTNTSTALITVVYNSGSASALDRIFTPYGYNLVIHPDQSLTFQYRALVGWLPVSQLDATNILGNGYGITPMAGFIGEQQVQRGSSATILSTYSSMTSAPINLTPGIWDISAVATFDSVADVSLLMAISFYTGPATPADGVFGDNLIWDSFKSFNVSNRYTMSIPSFRVTLTTFTPYYLLMKYFSGSPGTPDCRISATRVG